MMTEGFKRKLTAILSADVEGYSRLMDDDEEATVRTLTDYRTAINDLVQQYRGRVVDSPGDNILSEFTSVVDAVNCAVEIQKDLKQKNEDLPEDKRLEFRIGVNIGDVIQDGDRIYGSGVNVAARIEGLADPGGICISRNAYDHIRDKLDLGYEYLGDHKVKNIKHPVRVYKVLMDPEDAGKLVVVKAKPSAKRWVWPLAAVVIVLLGIVAWQLYQKMITPDFEPASVETMAFPLPEKPSIAVLPFRNMSGVPEQEYLGDGVAENIITALSQHPNVFVISRESSFFYKNNPKTIKEISEDLGVNYVLEGSIHKAENEIRVTAQLIDAIKGHHVWAKNYDREFKDLFSLYDDITLSILKGIHAEFDAGLKLKINTDNLDAYLKVLKGRFHLSKWTKEDNLIARKLFEEALNLDPNYSDAISYLSSTYISELIVYWSTDRYNSIQKAKELVLKAIELDKNNFLGHWVLSDLYLITGKLDKALTAIEEAIALNPGEGSLLINLSKVLRKTGQPEKAIGVLEKAMRLNPLIDDPEVFDSLAISYFMVGRYEESIKAWEKRLTYQEWLQFPHAGLTLCYLALSDVKKAKSHANKMLEANPSFNIKNFARSYTQIEQEEIDQLIKPLETLLYKESGKIAIYKYKGVPEFYFRYPATYKKTDSDFSYGQVVAFVTDDGQILSASVNDIIPGMTFDRLYEEVRKHFLKGYGSDIELKSEKEIILKDGTPAYRMSVNWTSMSGDIRFTDEDCVVFKNGKAIWLTITKRADDKKDLDWIVESLIFKEEDTPTRAPDKPSIAVLPFTNMSDDPEQGYFSDGMTEDIITDLSKIKDLLVISRNSTFTYKGQNKKIPEIAKELNVRYVLEGSVRRAGDQVRITAQLIDAKTDHHVWGERFDDTDTFQNIFELQDRITKKIVSALSVKLSIAEESHVSAKETTNMIAYDAFLKGKDHFYKVTPDDFIKAIDYFEQAIKLDPNYSRAYAALGNTYQIATDLAFTNQMNIEWETARRKAVSYLKIAMKNPTFEAYTLAADIELHLRHYEEMIAYAEKALSIAPNNAEVNWRSGSFLIYAGRPEEGIKYLNRALQLDPNDTRILGNVTVSIGIAHFSMGQLEQAVQFIKKGREYNPELWRTSAVLVASYALLGKDVEAKKEFENILTNWGYHPSIQEVYYTWPFKNVEVFDRLAEGLVKAGFPGNPSDYYKLVEENKLTGKEIRETLFGHTQTAIESWGEWWAEIDKEGNTSLRVIGTNQEWELHDKGKSWIEGDMVCFHYEKLFDGLTSCGEHYRNPDGNADTKSEYIEINHTQMSLFSVVD